MLEVVQRDGRARVLRWEPSEGKVAQTPALIVPETSLGRLPGQIALTKEPTGDGIELVSDGTWFFPRGAEGDLVVRAPQPEGTGVIQVLDVGEEMAVWHDAGGWANNPANGFPALLHARAQATSARLLWAPALGTPADYAVWTYLGVDAFDASGLLLAAIRGEALTPDGPMTLAQAEAIHGGTFDQERLIAFNLEQAEQELARIRLAIEQGTLRQLAERRCYQHPSTVAMLRRADREHSHLEQGVTVRSPKPVPCMTQESLWMPEVERFRRRLREDYRAPEMADVLVLLPCSARKPYRLSKTHRYFQRALDDSGIRHRVHEVMITSPMGCVPRDLEEVYPAGNYDVPVTGDWNADEETLIRQQVAALVENHDYQHIISHVDAKTAKVLAEILPEHQHTAVGRPSSKPDCDRLKDALRAIQKEDPRPFVRGDWNLRKMQDVQALASYQFGPDAAAALAADAKAHGRMPYVKLDGPEGQRAMITDKGLLSLTLEGAKIVAAHGTKRVFIEDFWPKKTGSLFAVGVTGADADVRPGDDVVMCFEDEVRGCGQALMSAEEMTHFRRGVAMQLRHVAKEAT